MATIASGQTEMCSHLKRQQKVTFHVDENAGNEADPLPIVELKPFVHKVWRREKSLPSFYNKTDIVPDVNKNKESATTTNTPIPQAAVPEAQSPVQRTTSISSQISDLPSPRLVQMYVSTFSDYRSQKEHLASLVGESSFRPKSRLHPAADTKNPKQPQYSESLIPGLLTREDRAKSTQTEINDGDSVSRAYSCSPKAVTPEEIRKQQEMKIKGERLNKNNNKKHLQYLIPLKNLYSPLGSHASGVRHGSPASLLFNSSKSRTSQAYKRSNTPLYDQLDRQGTLPSLAISSESLRRRSPSKYDDAQSEDYDDYREAFDVNKPIHNIGGIKNSFKVLSKHGVPTKVERQLSFELEVNLSRFRKSRDYWPFEISPSDMAKYYPQQNFNMTQGEKQLRKGLRSNAGRRNPRTESRGTTFTNSRSDMSYVSEQQFPQGTYKQRMNDMDHLDSYYQDSLYFTAYQSTPRMAVGKGVQTDDTLRSATVNTMHTMDTTTTGDEYTNVSPRSPLVSRVSGKLQDKSSPEHDKADAYSIRIIGKSQGDINKGTASMEVQQVSPSTSDSTYVSLDGKVEERMYETPQKTEAVQLNTGLPPGGLVREKTFITNSAGIEPVPVSS